MNCSCETAPGSTADQIGRRGNVIFYTSLRRPAGTGIEEEAWSLMATISDRLCEEMSLCGEPSRTPSQWASVPPSAGASGAYPR